MAASSTSSSDAAPVALVTGASRGIGRAVAELLAARGHRVIGTSRDPDGVPPAERPAGVDLVALDLEDRESVRRCAAEAGPVDVLVSNAGRSQMGALEEVPGEAVERLFAANVLGPVELIRLCLPAMRERGGGTVVVIGSLMAEFPVPFQSAYAASKLALQGFVGSLRTEVRPFGVRVALVEPGDIRTGIQDHVERFEAEWSPYAPALALVSRRARAAVASAEPPAVVAEKVWSIMSTKRPAPVHFAGGDGAALAFAKRLLPRVAVERLVARRYGL
ncbi:MAG TPA: SDR family oxidoreductase [Solirubrobacteraceae bacterium]|jgi:NAD(P)-dependent dehydrogenase (short-subunit alcohol dehydrogenase family)|nr:SDR family oxidoreductase [Solirubrobacteraceae bacterium]